MIQFPDYIHAVHEERRRAYEAAARAAVTSNTQTNRWYARRAQFRRAAQRRFHVSRSRSGFG